MSQPVQSRLTPAERAMTAAAYQTPEIWEAELRAARWTKKCSGVWESPCGELFRGPYGAWKVMRDVEANRRKSEIAREADRRLEREVLEQALCR